jgi:hypothetical protein
VLVVKSERLLGKEPVEVSYDLHLCLGGENDRVNVPGRLRARVPPVFALDVPARWTM